VCVFARSGCPKNNAAFAAVAWLIQRKQCLTMDSITITNGKTISHNSIQMGLFISLVIYLKLQSISTQHQTKPFSFECCLSF